MNDFQDWNATSPGVLALSHTQYEIRHERTGSSWFFNVYWRDECVRPCHMTLASAKHAAMNHLNDMLKMGYEV